MEFLQCKPEVRSELEQRVSVSCLLLCPDHIFRVLPAFVPVLSCSAVSVITNVRHLFKLMLCLATFVFLLLMQLQNCVHSVLIFYLLCYGKFFF